ncbi:sel1 repeat family protein [Campylobacter coli]|uniref:beta-lactamase n=1 Tax=Campylobacter coli TaxID=195 RepID=A0A5T1LAW1_CAMCO|nr:tetratricopeptide repeat protein [Campylobacter coli]EAI7420963.1 sel1 repeat family protein [Campylobacter hyointestinalis]EAL3816141.1 sel1 repeat family protein [Campylobacter fetus]EIA77266.1 putative periplasmic protein [Campylobacter coli 132-6]MCC3009721.1 sel1 repeat family protein [Campylobacter jejuni]AJW57865.1 Putative beta-lactamase HcpC precursor [Campylobacter coli]
MRIFFILSLFFHTLFAVDDLDNALRLYEGNKFVKAYEIFERLCEKDNARACFSLAYMNENAQGVARDFDKAYKFYDKSCKLGLAKACSNMALTLQDLGYVNESLLAFNKACNLGESSSCNHMGLVYEDEKDGQMATHFYKRSCDLKDARACYKLGFLYERGELVRQNLKSALAFYSKSCTLGFAEACYLIGRYYELEKKDLKKAKRYLGMACDKKHQEACAAYRKLNSQDIEIY